MIIMYKYFFIIFTFLFINISISLGTQKNIQVICKTNSISKKFTFLYIPSRSRVIWIEQGREIKIDKQENDKLYFTGFGVYGLGYDSWFQSELQFYINLKNGDFKITPDNKKHKNNPQFGKCFNKFS